MSFPSPSRGARDTTPRQRNATAAASTRTAGKRKVYGKRKVDAPKAVFEQRSPARSLENLEEDVAQDPVNCIQSKLAEVTISEMSAAKKIGRELSQSQKVDYEMHISNEIPSPHAEQHSEQSLISQSAVKTTTPLPPKRYQTMVEVRITPMDRPRRCQKSSQNAPDSEKQAARRTKPATKARLSSGCVSNEKANSYVRSILNEALSPIAAQSIQKFGSWAARAGTMLEVVKLAEGSYGEVYKLKIRDDLCEKNISKSKLARLKAYGDGVFKVVPLRAQSGPGSKKFTSIEELVAEVKMLKYLDPIPGFARFREIHVVQGRFPESFQKAWDHYKKTKDDCLNPNPSSKRAYPDSQIWAIVEMDDAGCELEKFSWSSIFQVYDIFWGVAMALARAEEYALFEHRDLHLGNVCIRTTRTDGRMNPPTDNEIMHQSYTSGFGLSTLETTLIDYSLSRAELLVGETLSLIEVASSDLDKKQIFGAIGQDEDEILLRDTYRHMRAQVYHGNPLYTEMTPDVPGIWAEYVPKTNLIWLQFLLKTLLKNRKPLGPGVPPPTRQPLARRSSNKELTKQQYKSGKKKDERITDIQRAAGTQGRVSQLKQNLEERLNAVLELLDLEHGHEDMCCAVDLVAFAIDSHWLEESDFF